MALPPPPTRPAFAKGLTDSVALEPLGIPGNKGARAQVAVPGQAAEGRKEGETVLQSSNAWAGSTSPQAGTDTRLSPQTQAGRARVVPTSAQALPFLLCDLHSAASPRPN